MQKVENEQNALLDESNNHDVSWSNNKGFVWLT